MRDNDGFKEAIRIFRNTVALVPAYRKFLKKFSIDHRSIRSRADFAEVPFVEKNNYLKIFKYLELFPESKIPPMVSASSGSSGVPFYWPRGDRQEKYGADAHEMIFNNIFRIGKKRTLVINCFSMGSWVAGTYTTACCRELSRRGYNLSVITPSLERNDALIALRDFSKHFEIVIIAGYPPLVMDLLVDAAEKGIKIPEIDLKILTAGESFSEKWRDQLLSVAGLKNKKNSCINIYGTADAGLMGHETPLTIKFRHHALRSAAFSRLLFGSFGPRATMVQYYPTVNYFEQSGNELCFTSDSGLPLVRYRIGDRGRLLTPDELIELAAAAGFTKKELLECREWLKYPAIIIFGRNDVSVSYYALNIYPEHLKAGLEHKSVITKVSGRFQASVMVIKRGAAQKLIINVELKRGVKPSTALKKKIAKSLFDSLMKLNSEYNKLFCTLGSVSKPVIRLDDYGDEKFQVKKAKVSWIKKNNL